MADRHVSPQRYPVTRNYRSSATSSVGKNIPTLVENARFWAEYNAEIQAEEVVAEEHIFWSYERSKNMSDLKDKNVDKLVRKILKSFAAKRVYFDVKKHVITLSNNSLRLNVKVLPQTRVADIKRCANDVRLSLKLASLNVVEEQNEIYLVVSNEQLVDEHHLLSIANTPEFAEALKSMVLPLVVGIDDLGKPVIVDLRDPRSPPLCH